MTTVQTRPTEQVVTYETMLPIISTSLLGTAIEWYDVYLYGFFSVSVFPTVFFPRLDPFAGIIAAFTTGLVGFAARPLGGAFFGWFGDRIGRRSTLVATLLLMGSSTLLMGILPGYATIGIAAPICLLVLRFLQGVGIGGEWGGAVLMAMEYGDDRRRGFWSCWPQMGVPVALALSALIVLLCEGLYPGDAFVSVGWRMPFLFGAMLVLVALYIRLRIMETPEFVRIQSEQRVSKAPLLDAWRYRWRQIILSALMRSGEQAPFYIFTTFMLSYGVETLHMSESLLFFGLTLAALVECISMPTFSALSDRLGRKRCCLIGNIVMGLYVLPYFLLLNTRNPWLVVLAMLLALPICHAWLYGLQAALIAEQFPTSYRYTGTSLGYQLASVTAGGPAPLIATYLLANRGPIAPYLLIVLYLVSLSVVSFVAILPLKEYAGKAPAE